MKPNTEISSLNTDCACHSVTATWLPHLNGRISKAQISGLAATLHHDEDGIYTLLRIMSDNPDSRTAFNAARILSNLSTEDKDIYLSPKTSELTELALSAQDAQNQRAYFSILADMPHADEGNMALLDFCMTHITDTKMSLACRSYMIKIAVGLCRPYPELMNELEICLDLLPAGLPPSLSAAKNNALRYIWKALHKKVR